MEVSEIKLAPQMQQRQMQQQQYQMQQRQQARLDPYSLWGLCLHDWLPP